jgi:transposase
MGQILHSCARTTEKTRSEIQLYQASIAKAAKRFGVNPKTIIKWRKRTTTQDAPMGPKKIASTVLSEAEEKVIVAFRKLTQLPLDDCLYTLQETIPLLSRSSLHSCFQRHGCSRLDKQGEDKKSKKQFKD